MNHKTLRDRFIIGAVKVAELESALKGHKEENRKTLEACGNLLRNSLYHKN